MCRHTPSVWQNWQIGNRRSVSSVSESEDDDSSSSPPRMDALNLATPNFVVGVTESATFGSVTSTNVSHHDAISQREMEPGATAAALVDVAETPSGEMVALLQSDGTVRIWLINETLLNNAGKDWLHPFEAPTHAQLDLSVEYISNNALVDED
jgi:hypothetical protein